MVMYLIVAQAFATTWTVGPTGDFRALADAVEGAGPGDTLILEAGEHEGCVDLGGNDLTLIGADGADATVLDGGGACDSALAASAGEALVIEGLTLRNSGGRGLYLAGGATLRARELVIEGSGGAGLYGGGLYVDGGVVSLLDSRLSGNRAAAGGNLFATGLAAIELDHVEVSSGSATASGAGVFLDHGTTLVSSSCTWSSNAGGSTHGVAIYTRADVAITSSGDTFEDNEASELDGGYHGGAIYLGERASLDLRDGAFRRNRAYLGGAIYQQTDGVVTLTDVVFEDNQALDAGGAIYGIDGLSLQLDGVAFTDNEALYGSGGAIALEDIGSLVALDATFEGQVSSGPGGAIYLNYRVDATIKRSSFTANTAAEGEGGALYHGFYGDLLVRDTLFEQNTAEGSGGAVALDYLGAEARFRDVSFISNTSEGGDGGALYAEDFLDVALSGALVRANTAAYDGGGLYFGLWGDVVLEDATVEENVAPLGVGGGICVNPSTSGAYELTVSDTTISANTAGRHGGGLYAVGLRGLALDTVEMAYNAADGDGLGVYHGGGLYLYAAGQVEVARSLFCANTAANGAGVYVAQVGSEGESTWSNNSFVENVASGKGGGAFFTRSEPQRLANNALLANEASSGGALFLKSTGATFVNNAVAWTKDGGGVYADAASASVSTLTFSGWYDNDGDDVGGALDLSMGEAGNIDESPGFADYSRDGDCGNDALWLSPSSDLVDAGDPDLLDPDGSGSDIGPYGGPASAAPDADGDGWGDAGWGGDDCDDTDADTWPAAPELPDDGLDQDCDGLDQATLAALVHGDLVLSEVMVDPALVLDARGEWFEVLNASPYVVDLIGLELTDLGADTYTVSGAVLVGPGAYALFAVRASADKNGGLPEADHVWTRRPFRFDNGSDEIVLSYDGLEFDRLAWGSSTGLIAPAGASLSLDPEATDATRNDDIGAWCAGSSAYGLGDLGTPGAPNEVCP